GRRVREIGHDRTARTGSRHRWRGYATLRGRAAPGWGHARETQYRPRCSSGAVLGPRPYAVAFSCGKPHPLFRKMLSRHQLVTTGFGYQDGRIGRIALNLLAQPINMGFERVRRDSRVVAPHFLQQDFARYRPLPGAVEIAQDGRLLLGQPHLVALGIDEKLRARPERVGPDGEDGVFAGFVLTQLRPDAREQH